MFDDPNLHWKSYGYVNYARLILNAARAQLPCFVCHGPAGWLAFPPGNSRPVPEKPKPAFVLVHGNNHTTNELARTRDDTKPARRSPPRHCGELSGWSAPPDSKVSRVMAAPHGACTHDMATVLLRTGFEAACISRGSIMHHNPGTAWPASVGLNPAEFLGAGLAGYSPVPAQAGMRNRDDFGGISGPAGHTRGTPRGRCGRSGFACRIGGRAQFHRRGSMDGHEIHRPIQFLHPPRRRSLAREDVFTENPPESAARRESTLCPQTLAERRRFRGVDTADSHGCSGIVSIVSWRVNCDRSCEEIEVHAVPADAIDPRTVSISRTPLWAVARRQLAETRDRLKPMAARLFATASPQRICRRGTAL